MSNKPAGLAIVQAASTCAYCLSTKDEPGLLMDVRYDDKGDMDRERFLVEVQNGKHVVVETLPPLNP